MISQLASKCWLPEVFVAVLVLAAASATLYAQDVTPPGSPILSVDEAQQDLDDLQRQLEQRFSYLRANGVDVDEAIQRTKNEITGPISVLELSNRISKLIALFIDGHAGPRLTANPKARLPFKIEISGNQYVAVKSDRSGFVDDSMPFVRRIGGILIERWIAAADPYLADGSPQMVRRRAVREIQHFSALAEVIGVSTTSELAVELYSQDGKSTTRVVSPAAPDADAATENGLNSSGIFQGNIGYFRIPTFSSSANVPELVSKWMPRFEQTDALIIDVRGNGGGSRAGLVELFPYFLKEREAHVANVSAYRLYSEFGENHLSAARFSYLESDDRWRDWERRSIHDFAQSFNPEWKHRQNEFSEWHYLLLSRRKGDPRYHYGKQVFLLIDGDCFSATDIFVGAFKGFRNTLVVGQSTSGGSARSVTERLPNSKIPVRLASMVSFQPDGQLYDGRGIHPDIHIDPTPESYLLDGEDNVLAYVLEKIKVNDESDSSD